MNKIFIVEDDSTIANSIKNNLISWGFEAKVVEDFKNVIEEFQNFSPNLVLLDITLPFFNGYHWCKVSRENSKVPIIFFRRIQTARHFRRNSGSSGKNVKSAGFLSVTGRRERMGFPGFL